MTARRFQVTNVVALRFEAAPQSSARRPRDERVFQQAGLEPDVERQLRRMFELVDQLLTLISTFVARYVGVEAWSPVAHAPSLGRELSITQHNPTNALSTRHCVIVSQINSLAKRAIQYTVRMYIH